MTPKKSRENSPDRGSNRSSRSRKSSSSSNGSDAGSGKVAVLKNDSSRDSSEHGEHEADKADDAVEQSSVSHGDMARRSSVLSGTGSSANKADSHKSGNDSGSDSGSDSGGSSSSKKRRKRNTKSKDSVGENEDEQKKNEDNEKNKLGVPDNVAAAETSSVDLFEGWDKSDDETTDKQTGAANVSTEPKEGDNEDDDDRATHQSDDTNNTTANADLTQQDTAAEREDVEDVEKDENDSQQVNDLQLNAEDSMRSETFRVFSNYDEAQVSGANERRESQDNEATNNSIKLDEKEEETKKSVNNEGILKILSCKQVMRILCLYTLLITNILSYEIVIVFFYFYLI